MHHIPPFTNGLVEWLVQTFKRTMSAGESEGIPMHYQLVNFLQIYRSLSHSTTSVAPGDLFFPNKLCTSVHSRIQEFYMGNQDANKQLLGWSHVDARCDCGVEGTTFLHCADWDRNTMVIVHGLIVRWRRSKTKFIGVRFTEIPFYQTQV